MSKKRKGNSIARRKLRASLFTLQGGKCFWCGDPVTMEGKTPSTPPANYATLDELKPRGHGGTRARLNTVVSCVPCNAMRDDGVAPKWAFERVAERERLNATVSRETK